MARNPNRELFDDLPPATGPGALVALPGSRTQHSPAQRQFNRLVQQVQQQRERLAQWQAAHQAWQARAAAELPPVAAQVHDAQARLARCLDAVLSAPAKGERLVRRQRAKLAAFLTDLLANLLEGELPDALRAEMAALHDRHAALSLAEDAELDKELAEAMLSDLLGRKVELDDADAACPNGYLGAAAEHLAQQAQAQQQRAEAKRAARAQRRQARGLPPTPAERATQAREQAEQQAGQTVREVFRRLASALHPDRATDAADKARRTGMMQRVNDAYARNDLLALLGLQIEVEQIDAGHLAGLSDERIAAFNLVLKEQLRTLDAEVAELTRPLLQHGRLRRAPQPQDLPALVDQDLARARRTLADIDEALAAAQTPTGLRAFINQLPDADEAEAAGLAELLRAMAVPAPPRRRRR